MIRSTLRCAAVALCVAAMALALIVLGNLRATPYDSTTSISSTSTR